MTRHPCFGSMALACLLGGLLACGGDDEVSDDGGSGLSGAGGGSGAAGPGGSGAAGGGVDPRAQAVCERWTSDRADMFEGTFSGDVGSCTAGDVSADGRANALKILNLYRFLAQLPEVTTDPTRDAKAQECALMMEANMQLSHTPPMSWLCYSAEGAEAASKSNISTAPGVIAVDRYMIDITSVDTMGHRRWILSNSLGPVGIGSTVQGSSCLWVIEGTGSAGAPWMSWPPPGPVPAGIFDTTASLDEAGWTFQSADLDPGSASVTVTEDGVEVPVAVSALPGNYGGGSAIRMVPQGWTSKPGSRYEVTVTGTSTPVTYAFDVVACD